ncbi:MAG: hypothetical protein A2Z34_00405 [Planctomycetes bacterium RBG_16_59_8]|nr:MAG: hypothetical protein A2Z34_00405 [Planctomycetes bacterium RBG_16_59_8]
MDEQERRRKKRYGIRESTVRFQQGKILSFLKSRSAKYLIVNISSKGLTFYSKEALVINETLRMKIESPKCAEPITVHGRVAWVVKATEMEAYRVGVEFQGTSDKARSDLKKLLDSAILDDVEVDKKTFLKEIEKP